MTLYPVKLNVPPNIYAHFKRRAEQSHRSIEIELLEAVSTVVPDEEKLPVELAEAIAPLPLLDDESLLRAARMHLSAEAATEMETLHIKRQRDGLSNGEEQTLQSFLNQYERIMLIRAQSAVELKKRGIEFHP